MKASFRKKLLPFFKPLLALLYFFRFKKLQKEIDRCFEQPRAVFFFFPAYHMGGAENVHLQIMDVVKDRPTVTFIAHKSSSSALKKEFVNRTTCFIDFGDMGNYSYFQKRIKKRLVQHFNAINYRTTIFGCNVFMFYDVVDAVVNDNVKTVDLIHAFSPYANGAENRRMHSVDRIDATVVINAKTKEDLQKQYFANSISLAHLNSTSIIYNRLNESCSPMQKAFSLPLHCLWIGRGSAEKRPWLFIEIAREALEKKLPFVFSMVGKVDGWITDDAPDHVKLIGPVFDPEKLKVIYRNNDLLFTTSLYEGIPLTIMEGICNGLINLSTDVGGINEIVRNDETGFLIPNDADEKQLVKLFVSQLEAIASNPQNLAKLYLASVELAHSKFSAEKFSRQYRSILLND